VIAGDRRLFERRTAAILPAMPRALPISAALAILLSSLLPPAAAQQQIDINRPRSPYECDLPHAIRWYGSQDRCLQELCIGWNITNQWSFEAGGRRRRRNPCYGVNPRSFED
jgi:hypothetical protein